MSAILIGLGSLAAALGIGLRRARSKSVEYKFDRDLYRAEVARYEEEADSLRERLTYANRETCEAREHLTTERTSHEVQTRVNARDERLKSARDAANAIRSRTGGRP